MIKSIKPLTLGATVLALCLTANGQTIYQNNFSGKPATTILGTAPDTANSFAGGSSSATWNLSDSNSLAMLANGSISQPAGDAQFSTLLPFTASAGYLYALTATVTMPANSGNWVGLGFAENDPAQPWTGGAAGRFTDTAVTGDPWLLLATGNKFQAFAGPQTGNQFITAPTGGVTIGAGTYNLEIDLNTLNANWSTTVFVNGIQQGTFTYSANPTIGAVGLTSNDAAPAVTWDSFELQAVPEPTSFALIGAGMGALMFIRRLKA